MVVGSNPTSGTHTKWPHGSSRGATLLLWLCVTTRNWLIQILSKAFPFAIPALNIRIASIAIDATSTNGIFLEVEDIRIRHPIQNLPHRPDSSTLRADQGLDSPASFSGHAVKVLKATDKMFCDRELAEIVFWALLVYLDTILDILFTLWAEPRMGSVEDSSWIKRRWLSPITNV